MGRWLRGIRPDRNPLRRTSDRVETCLLAGLFAALAAAAPFAAVAGLGALYLGSAAAARLLLNRRRMAAWDADWLVTAPARTRRRR